MVDIENENTGWWFDVERGQVDESPSRVAQLKVFRTLELILLV